MYRFFCLALALISLLAAGCHSPRPGVLRLPVTTSVLASVVTDVSGGLIEPEILVPPGNCPAHFDIKASHLKLMEDTGVLFAHGFEDYLERFRSRVGNPDFRISAFPLEGSWLVPAGQVELYRLVTSEMAALYPELAEELFLRLGRVEADIGRVAGEVSAMFAASGKHPAGPVIANEHLAGTLRYLGFEVVGVYDRAEDLTPSRVAQLVEKGLESGVTLVVDNLQSGAETGIVIARELDAGRVVLSNFPGAFPGTPTMRETLKENARLLREAL